MRERAGRRCVDRRRRRSGVRAVVVFDGQGSDRTVGRTRVRHSGEETADTVIERLAHRHAADAEVTVVSTDTVVRHVAQRGGVHAMSAREFLDRLAAAPEPPRGGPSPARSATSFAMPSIRATREALERMRRGVSALWHAALDMAGRPGYSSRPQVVLEGQLEASSSFHRPLLSVPRRSKGVPSPDAGSPSDATRGARAERAGPDRRPRATVTSGRWTRSSAATRDSCGSRRARTSWPAATRNDLIQEGLVGLYKAVRDFRSDKETSFRSFAELCITRQIITAIKTATRFKHAPLNTYVSFSHTPAGQEGEADCTLGDALPGPSVDDPATCVISTEELQSLLELPWQRALAARGAGADLLPRGPQLRGDRRAARLRPQDGRQRAAAGQAQGAVAPAVTPHHRLTIDSRSRSVESAERRDSSAGRAFAL